MARHCSKRDFVRLVGRKNEIHRKKKGRYEKKKTDEMNGNIPFLVKEEYTFFIHSC